MMTLKMSLLMIGVVISLTGCIRSNVAQLTDDTAVISAKGSVRYDMGDIKKKLLQEAANTTAKHGYEIFRVTGSDGGYTTSYWTAPAYSQSTTTGNAQIIGNNIYGSSTTNGFYAPGATTVSQRPHGSIEIKMAHGTCQSSDPDCYDAKSILKFTAAE